MGTPDWPHFSSHPNTWRNRVQDFAEVNEESLTQNIENGWEGNAMVAASPSGATVTQPSGEALLPEKQHKRLHKGESILGICVDTRPSSLTWPSPASAARSVNALQLGPLPLDGRNEAGKGLSPHAEDSGRAGPGDTVAQWGQLTTLTVKFCGLITMENHFLCKSWVLLFYTLK